MEMQPKPKAGPKDVFMHLLAIGTLYASAVSLIALLFQYVNRFLPDVLNPVYFSSSVMRNSIAVLIIVFPVYIFLTRHLNKDIAGAPEKQQLGIRRWLVHLTLFVSAITIIVDLITLVRNFLEGELTPRFLLKILIVLLVASAIFAYYIWDLKRPGGALPAKMKNLGWTVSVIILASVVAGFIVAGSPFSARKQQFDQRRINDLQTLQWQIVDYWQNKERLPEALAILQDPLSGFIPPIDPETGTSYKYQILGPLSFELCGTFSMNSELGIRNQWPYPATPPPMSEYRGKLVADIWDHSAGRVCFSRTIDPDFYPVRPSVKM